MALDRRFPLGAHSSRPRCTRRAPPMPPRSSPSAKSAPPPQPHLTPPLSRATLAAAASIGPPRFAHYPLHSVALRFKSRTDLASCGWNVHRAPRARQRSYDRVTSSGACLPYWRISHGSVGRATRWNGNCARCGRSGHSHKSCSLNPNAGEHPEYPPPPCGTLSDTLSTLRLVVPSPIAAAHRASVYRADSECVRARHFKFRRRYGSQPTWSCMAMHACI